MSSVSEPSASASFGAAATRAGKSDDRKDADQYVDDLGGRRSSTHRRIGLRAIGRDCAADGDQRGEADQRQCLRIEFSTPEPITVVLRDPSIADRQPAQPFHVIHSARTPLPGLAGCPHCRLSRHDPHHHDRVNPRPAIGRDRVGARLDVDGRLATSISAPRLPRNVNQRECSSAEKNSRAVFVLVCCSASVGMSLEAEEVEQLLGDVETNSPRS